MKIKKVNRKISHICLISVLYSCNAFCHRFEVLPTEQIILDGDLFASKKILCTVKPQEQNMLNFISLKNTSIINHVVMREGAMMLLSFSPDFNDGFSFEMEPEAQLAINNETTTLLHLNCHDWNT